MLGSRRNSRRSITVGATGARLWLAGATLAACSTGACSLLNWDFQAQNSGGGGGGVSGSSGTGGTGGMAPPPPAEACGLPGDEDDNNLADCADPACTCTDNAPPGWSGPFTLREGTTNSPPSCEAPSVAVFQGGADLQQEPAQCSTCTCSDPTNPSCSGNTLTLYAGNGCTNGTAGTVPFSAGNNTCVAGNSFALSVNIPASNALDVTGTCAAGSPQTPTLPPPAWSRVAIGCSDGAAGAGCGLNQVCAHDPKGAEALCISKPGDVDCPTGLYAARKLYYADVTDARSCTDCSCQLKADGCAGTYLGYSNTGCTAQVMSEPGTSAHCAPLNGAVRFSFVPGQPQNPTCAANVAEPLGCVTQASPVTVCCTAGADPCPKGMFLASPPGQTPYCVDTTEVTQQAYADFLATSPPTAGQPAYCGFNTNYQPNQWPPAPGEESLPVTNVDWCDAYAYCAWAGKRLCGKIGGGAADPAAFTDPATSQWYAACSKGGTQMFPYGNTQVDGVCADNNNNNNGPSPVASFPCCVGGYPGLYDMVGNVQEWEDACEAQNGSGDACRVRGAAYNTNSAMGCADDRTQGRSYRADRVGFRCCGQ